MDHKIRYTKLVTLMDALKVKGLQVNKVRCVANFVSKILQGFETKVCKVIVRSRHIGVLGSLIPLPHFPATCHFVLSF